MGNQVMTAEEAKAVDWLLEVRRRGGGMRGIEAANSAFRSTGRRCRDCGRPLEQAHCAGETSSGYGVPLVDRNGEPRHAWCRR